MDGGREGGKEGRIMTILKKNSLIRSRCQWIQEVRFRTGNGVGVCNVIQTSSERVEGRNRSKVWIAKRGIHSSYPQLLWVEKLIIVEEGCWLEKTKLAMHRIPDRGTQTVFC